MRPTGWTEMSIWELNNDKRIVSCQERCTIGRNDRERETEDWRESAERGPEVSWNEREAAARSRYVSSAGSPANRSTVGAAGRRRQFRADRRCNHPRPCPPLLSGPSGGLFSLPPCRAAPQQSPRLFLLAYRAARSPLCVCVCETVAAAALRSEESPAGSVRSRTPRLRECLSAASDCVRTATSHATNKLVGCFSFHRYVRRLAPRLDEYDDLRRVPSRFVLTLRVRIFAWSVIYPTVLWRVTKTLSIYQTPIDKLTMFLPTIFPQFQWYPGNKLTSFNVKMTTNNFSLLLDTVGEQCKRISTTFINLSTDMIIYILSLWTRWIIHIPSKIK